MRRFNLKKLDLKAGQVTPTHPPQVGDFYRDSDGIICAVTKLYGSHGDRADWMLVMATGIAEVLVENMPVKFLRDGAALIPERT